MLKTPLLRIGVVAAALAAGIGGFLAVDVGGLSPLAFTRTVDGCPETIWSNMAVDWVPFVRIDGTTYYEDWSATIDPALVGQPFSEVQCRFGDDVQDNIKPRDGDAAFLAPGTPLMELSGFARSFRLVVDTPDGLRLYSAMPEGEGPARDVFGDLDLIATGIAVKSETGETNRTGYINDPATVQALVGNLLNGSFGDWARSGEGGRYSVEIEFGDAPALTLLLWSDEARIHPDLPVSEEFVEAIVGAVNQP